MEEMHALYADWPALEEFWRAHAVEEFPALAHRRRGPLTHDDFLACVRGLLTYFRIVARAGSKQTMLVSLAADSLWHAWLEFDPAGLDAATTKLVGRAVPHVPADSSEFGDAPDDAFAHEDAITRTFVVHRELDGGAPAAESDGEDGVPFLFALDERLAFPGGFAYSFQACEAVGGARVLAHCDSHASLASGTVMFHGGVRAGQTPRFGANALLPAAWMVGTGGGGKCGGGKCGGGKCGGGCGGVVAF